jgi:ribonucleotide monophosphatase NagD (HAD superfamily)
MEEVSCDASGESYPYDSVVIGLAPQLLDYTHLNTAFRILTGEQGRQPSTGSQTHITIGMPRKIPLIATHKVKYIETESPPGLSLGPGPFVAALETAANIKAHVIGKPTTLFFQTVIHDLYKAKELTKCRNNSSGKIAIIGDDVEADLGDGAIELGLWRVLGMFRLQFRLIIAFNRRHCIPHGITDIRCTRSEDGQIS